MEEKHPVARITYRDLFVKRGWETTQGKAEVKSGKKVTLK